MNPESTDQQSIGAKPQPPGADRIRRELIKRLFFQSRAGVFGAQIGAVLLVIALWNSTPSAYLLSWLAGYLVIQIPRNGLLGSFGRADGAGAAAVDAWASRFCALTVVSGLFWGLAGFLFFPGSSVHQFLLALFVAGIASAAAVAYAPLTQCYMPTVIAELLPLACACFKEGGSPHIMMGTAIVIYMVVLIITGSHVRRVDHSAIRLMLENQDLVGHLQLQNEKVERLNEVLRTEIEQRIGTEQIIRRAREDLETNVEERTAELTITNEMLVKEIAERRRTEQALRRSEEKYRIVVENAHEMILVVQDSRIVFLNSRAVEYLEPGKREFDIAAVLARVHPDDADMVTRRYSDRLSGHAVTRSYSLRMLDEQGEVWWIDVNDVAVVWAGEPALLVFATDVSDRKRAELELLKAREGLEQRVAERTHQLSRINDDLVFEISERRRAEERLSAGEARYRALLGAVPDPVIVYDPEGRVNYVNETFTETYGWHAEEVLGTILDFVPDDELEKTKNAWSQAVKGLQSTFETRRLTKWGTVLDVQIRTAILRQENGTHFSGICIHRDVTAQRRAQDDLRRSERKLRSLFDGATEVIQILDSSGIILQTNPASVILTGYGEEDFVGRNISDFLTPDSGKAFFAKLPMLLATGQCRHEMDLVCKDGRTIRLDCSASTIRDSPDDVVSVVVFQRDVTEKMRALMAAEQAANDLKQALRISRELRIESEKANRAKSEFLANMSHELRTPLNSIIGFSEILEDRLFGPLNDKQVRYVRHVLASGRHLLQLINDILDLAKVESGKMELWLEPVRIAQMLTNSLAMIREKAAKRSLGVDIRIDESLEAIEVQADEVKLKQIMFNLLSNAIKFTPEGGRILVEARQGDGEITVTVSDTGVGLLSEDLDRIFNAFEQVDSSYSRRQEGTGLGLALTKRMVELHKGTVVGESDGPGSGSRFTFTIPLKLGEQARIGIEVGPRPKAYERLPAISDLALEPDDSSVGIQSAGLYDDLTGL
ncbi:MAG: PAS domain S-box protein, partial [Pseudomonadota bacterium]